MAEADDVAAEALDVDLGSDGLEAALASGPATSRELRRVDGHGASFEDDPEVARAHDADAPATGPLAHNIKRGTTTYVDATRRGFRKGKGARIPWVRVFFTGIGLGLICLGVVIIVLRNG